jgi:SAM-dependent methyltransferase
MGGLVQFVTPLHQATSRAYIDRMVDDKVHCMLKAKEYETDYWDGHRRYGYGGYKYIPGRWKPVAESLIEHFDLTGNSSVLDVGCGKGFLLYEMKQILPELNIAGFDISGHGLSQSREEIRDNLFHHKAQDSYPYENNSFDLVISLGCLHNLRVFELEKALKEIDRVGRQGYVMVESYRSEQEQFNLQCWALTCESFFDVDEWVWLYDRFGYTGDYEFIFFE